MADPFEFAEGMVKQLLTLATGSLGGIIAFFDNEDQPGVQLAKSLWLMSAISLLAVSVVAGIVTLGCLTAQLAQKGASPNVNAKDVRIPATIQMAAFGFGVVAVAIEIMFR